MYSPRQYALCSTFRAAPFLPKGVHVKRSRGVCTWPNPNSPSVLEYIIQDLPTLIKYSKTNQHANTAAAAGSG